MKKQLKNIGFFLLALIVSVIGFSSCENDLWNQHYKVDNNGVSNKTLWETIKTNPELSEFAWAVRVTGYDVVLSSSQMLTVWAPTNSDANGIDTLALSKFEATPEGIAKKAKYLLTLKKQFVENHISRYSYSVSGFFDRRIVLLNKKITHFITTNQNCTFGGINIVSKNSISKNGILHVIDAKLSYFPNLWELLSTNSQLDSLKNYLYAFDMVTFDPSISIPGDVNENGDIVYLDSVKYNNNAMYKVIGRLSSEDSTYVAILPSNVAWNNSYANISQYFKYFNNLTTTEGTPRIVAKPDTIKVRWTLQRKYTSLSLVKDLVFSKSMQYKSTDMLANDSLRSTSLTVFQKPQYLFENIINQPTSNGSYFLCDELRYKHYESWNKEIRVEGEKSVGRNFDYANVFERTYQDNDTIKVSKDRYVEVTQFSAAIPPSVNFLIPNTLSGKLKADKSIEYGAAYNIYCVFLPSFIKDGTRRPAKVSFTLSYTNDAGKIVNIIYDNNKAFFETDKNYVSKILVASNVTFPYSEFGIEIPTVKLKITSNAKATESVKYTRDMLIDCIILEPVR